MGEDLDAVKPTYRQRFSQFAKRTRIELIEWHIWNRRFEHADKELTITKVAKIKLEEIPIEAPTAEHAEHEASGGAAMWVTGRGRGA